MPDPAIRAALDAAVVGYDVARVVAHGGTMTRDGMSDANRATITPMMAAAIAAFLRALPYPVLPNIYGRGGVGAIQRLAAAVEEAARDA